MLTPWKIVFHNLNPGINSQILYDEIFKLALNYKLKKHGLSAMPIDNKTLTDAIFDLNSHDKIETPINREIISGQDLKELFITVIFLRNLELNLVQNKKFFIVLPQSDNSCDTAIMIVDSNTPIQKIKEKEFKLPEKHIPLVFQIKEYVDFRRLNNDTLMVPTSVNIEKLGLIVGGYSDYILVFMRDFSNYNSNDLKKFFKKNPKCFLISIAGDIEYIPDGEKEYKPIPLNKEKHNYIITSPKETFAVVSFDRPSCLVESFKVFGNLKKI